ncbi:hydroxyurea phosphotransferase [Elioraea sp. Yellowstone]|jgi:streptomycin 6-kinase|uniref:aminoglycoside phosphotransferase family protein n=1 Tax=Elioraea sp. Yellowstone TaxID=2592070 RepID=UPI0011534A29|nr:aminoglycoside phosphotransferase family protein [Elioraea sp. Yellowstone]TQF82021.1 hydroxyurea phosphotransferase [Elioraea sp. Yellowstone]
MNGAEPRRSAPGPQEWRAALAARAAEVARDWGLALGPVLPGATQGLVRAVRLADGTQAVLKLEKPGQGVEAQAAALAAWAGDGSARLLRFDAARGALLLERLVSGEPLAALCEEGRDDAATAALAGLMLRLHRPAPPGALFADAHGWIRAIEACRDPRLDPRLRDRALGLYRDLNAAARPPVLLHGDLHHLNVLRDGDGWRAIDPFGATGEPGFDAGTLLTTPVSWLPFQRDLAAIQVRRVALLAERLGTERGRIAGWGFVVGVLKTVWDIEDGTGDGRHWRAATEALAPMTRA